MEQRYGITQVCSVGTYSALQPRQAIKDFARLMGIPFQEVNMVTKILETSDRKYEDIFIKACGNGRLMAFIHKYPELINEISIVLGAPKTQSIHACATMIFPDEHDMFHWVPIRKQEGMYVSEWEGNEMDSAGFLKEDILGIKQLDKFQNILKLIKENHGVDIDIYNLSLDDKEVYRYFKNGWNGDVFHFGSSGLTSYCKEMQPDNIEDLVVAISLYRPGAMENNFHNEYIARKRGEKPVEYFVGTEPILKNTLGIFCFQEQIMRLCQDLGGLSLVEADDVRKAMVKKKYEELTKYRGRFIPYYVENFKVDLEYAEHVWDAIDKASTYLFNKCISGKEKIKRHSRTNDGWHPTISEMYKVKNDRGWAKLHGHLALHDKYNGKSGYGCSWSLREDGRLVKNRIKDIYYQGIKETFSIKLESGKVISVTSNHKFPTNNGYKKVKELDKEKDLLFVYDGYVNEPKKGCFTDKTGVFPFLENSEVEKYELNSSKGIEGFTSKGLSTNYTKFDYYRKKLKKDFCEKCGKKYQRLEIHHIDGDHANNEFENLMTVCSSCHKKFHYKIGRTKMGEKGLATHFEKILSIESNGEEEVYDVEMENPYHSFTIENGIVTCNSHAVAYTLTGYISQWLKVHYPLEYWTVAFSYASDEDYAVYIQEINASGNTEIVPPDVNKSEKYVSSDVKTNKMYWSLLNIKQVGDRAADQIFNERIENGEYFSLADFADRNLSYKENKVNKRVIENIIMAGGFDVVEKVQKPHERMKLITDYREMVRQKVNEEKDLFVNNPKTEFDWWWLLQQKSLTGFALFDYNELINKYLAPKVTGEYPIIDFDKANSPDFYNGRNTLMLAGGIVYDISIRNSARGNFARLVLEQNYKFLKVTIFSQFYEELESYFANVKGNILLMNGSMAYDNYNKEPYLQTRTDSKFVILT